MFIINKIEKIYWLLLAIFIRIFVRVNNHRIFCFSYSFNKYACNPRAITEYLLDNTSEYEIYWAFNKNIKIPTINSRIHIVRKYSLKYFLAIYSSKFVFNNRRNDVFDSLFFKKKNQKYIMTWHGSFPLKKIEKDAEDKLSKRYLRNAHWDSQMCDLMLSNSDFLTNLIYKSFWYNGEILKKCLPRNDVFYDKNQLALHYRNVRSSLGLSPNCKIVLYAPTFRGNGKDLEYYQINWNNIIPLFEKMLGGKVEVLLRLHPNIANIEGVEKLIINPHIHNVTNAPDITEFLFAADAMISDYTSAMFDYAILRKPCFIYAIDKNDYDRGFYWSFEELPFPLAESQNQLNENIISFNNDKYLNKLNDFISNVWGIDEDGHSCERIYKWMKKI